MVPQNGFSIVQKNRVKIQLIRWRDKKGKEFDQYWIKFLHSWSDQRLHARNHSALFDTLAGIVDQTCTLKSHCITLEELHAINIYK